MESELNLQILKETNKTTQLPAWADLTFNNQVDTDKET